MQLTIIKQNRLDIVILPKDISGNYWITDFENGRRINLINIEASSEGWKLVSNNDAFVVDNKDNRVDYAILKEECFYLFKNNYKNEKYYIYCSQVYDTSFKEYNTDFSKPIIVGSDGLSNICYKLGGVVKNAFAIVKEDNYYYLVVNDKLASVYINQKRVRSKKRLEYGDVIFMFGLKIILMKKNDKDYLLVNNPNNLIADSTFYASITPIKDNYVEDYAELSDDSIYNSGDYFYRTPYFYKTIKPFQVKLDNPPTKKEPDKTPAILTVGPMVTMAMMSVVMLLSTFNSISRGEATVSSSITSIVMSGVMLASCLLWPLITKAYQRFADKMYEKKRQNLYKDYLAKKEREIAKALEEQKAALKGNYFTVSECIDIIKSHSVKLWQRRITDEDFLTLPVGIGDVPMQVEIKYPEEHFSLSEDNLLDLAYDLGKKDRIIRSVPITYSFFLNIITGIVGNAVVTKDFIDRVILQLMCLYSYDEVKIVIFTSKDHERDWDYAKTIPHSWSNDRSFRFFGSSNDDYREIIYILEKIFNERKSQREQNRFSPHYVIITDSIKSIDNYDFIKAIMDQEQNLGFSFIMLVDKVSNLPNECKNFINASKEECAIFSSIINEYVQKFKIDFSSIEDIYNCARELANIPIDIKNEAEASLPDTYQFLEMYQVGKVEQLNARDRWKKSNPILSLQAPVGIGKSQEIINLDLHEKYHGPHGLIAGTTGSGKSEFIITYILSLAINYHPYEVQIILIDYKGGSLAGAFSNDKYRLPHLAGTITNLDGNELNRSLASIESEIKRRQREFNEAKKITNESTIDIYKYQKLWREGKLLGKEPISHLFIISDEFAELKEQQPEFMDKLISAARVGRSLGIHLILATQKPGGVVDPQIWSNTRFRVCLKVQDTADSNEVLKKPDAAYLKKVGRFYLQVGFDEVYTLGQSAWAGGNYFPSATFKKEMDTSVNIINNIGFVISSKDVDNGPKIQAEGEELPNIVRYLSNVALEEKISIRRLWLDKIPSKIYIDALKEKYHFVKTPYYLNPIIGEYDDPENQDQYALHVPFSKLGNAIIYGITGSGKENFLISLIYSCMVSYDASEVNFYILDFGAETLSMFRSSPLVADIAFVSEQDKVVNLFKMLNEELIKRKKLFANYGGNYNNYIKSKAGVLPNYVVIINNFESFMENYEESVEELNQLSREAFKYGIFFVITASNDNSIRLRTRQNFALVYALQQNSEMDYMNILGNVRGRVPAKFKGRGLFRKGNIYEFQTAYVTDLDDVTSYIVDKCKTMKSQSTYKLKKIPVLPENVDFQYVKDDLTNDARVVIGVNKDTLLMEKFNLKKNAITLVSSYELENTLSFIYALIDQVSYTKSYEILFVNTTEQAIVNSNLEGRVLNRDYDNIVLQLANYIEQVYKIYEENKYDVKVIDIQKKFMCIIYGAYDFISKLNNDSRAKLNEIMKQDNQMGLVSFVLVDNPDALKNFAYEEWFKAGADTTRGIWIGSGIADQSLYRISKITREDREDITNDFGYIIMNSKIKRVKLINNFNSLDK